MRLAGWSLLAALLASGPLLAQEIDRGALDQLKSASCFVVVKSARGRSTGSGVLFLKRGTVGYVLTCEHVTRGAEKVGIVFASGTAREKALIGTVIGSDADRDLACVILRDVKELPEPLEVGSKTTVTETENVYVAGFPFGRLLAAGEKNPEISITKVSVSSVRRDTDDRIVLVQMSGDVNPGNSGGPVVDAKGKVIGITQSKVEGTSTAFAAPGEEIQFFLKGRVSSSTISPKLTTPASVRHDVRIGLIDPLGTLKNVTLWWCKDKAFEAANPKPDKDGRWSKAVESMKSVDLKIDEDAALGSLTIPRDPADPLQVGVQFQISWETPDGKALWTGPTPLSVDFVDAPKGSPPDDAPTSAPAAAPYIDLDVPDDLKILATQPLRAVIPDLILSPDGRILYALDLSEGKIWGLNSDTLEIVSQVDIVDDAVSMCLTQDGKTIYVGARASNRTENGKIQVVSTDGLKTTSTFAVPLPVTQIAATNEGTVILTLVGQWNCMAFIDAAKQTMTGREHGVYGGCILRLHPDQQRVYTGEVNSSPGSYQCIILRKNSKGQYESHHSMFAPNQSLGGSFEITPDGRFLIGQFGSVLRLGRTRETDLQFAAKIDPGKSVGVGRNCNTFFVGTEEGFLKVYTLEGFVLKKSVKVGKLCSRLILDPERKRLYAVALPVPEKARDGFGYLSKPIGVGNVISISLEAK